MTGAEADEGTIVLGATVIVSVSLADDAGVEYDVAIVIDFCSVVVPGSLVAAPGSVVSVFVNVNIPVASEPGASGPYCFDVASSVKSEGAVIVTLPLGAVVDQLCTSTGNEIVSPMPIDCTAAERWSRSACGAVLLSHWSNS